MVTKYVLPMLAVAGVVFSVYTVIQAQQVPPPAQPIVEPPTRPDRVTMIAGSGLVEARRENIPIGVNIPGVVTEVFVKKGEKVKAGAPLFRTDDRDFKAQLEVRLAELASAEGPAPQAPQRARGPRTSPRPGRPPRRPRPSMNDAEAAMARTERLFAEERSPPAITTRIATRSSPPRRPMPGPRPTSSASWPAPGRRTSRSPAPSVRLAQSQVDSIKTNLERLIVRAPMDGEVLQLNIRLGPVRGPRPGRSR